MTWWESNPLQSISKSGEQTKKSRKITLPQIIACTLYFLKFLKQSGVSHLIFQLELPVFPQKWLVFSGLSLRFQVAGYLLLVAGEVASSHGAPLPPPPPRRRF